MTLWACWATSLLALFVATVVGLAASLPCHLMVEAPFASLWRVAAGDRSRAAP